MRRIRIHHVILAAALAAGCDATPTEPPIGPIGPSEPRPERPGPVLRLTLTPASATLRAGERLQLRATAASADGAVARAIAVTWASADEEIATVSATGLVRGLRPGQVEVTVRWGTSQAKARISVLKGIAPPVL